MHILLIHQFFLKDDDGGGSRWNEMSRIWIEEGYQVTVLTGTVHYMGQQSDKTSRKYFAERVNKDGVKVISCHVSESYTTGFYKKLWAFISFIFSSIYGGIFYGKDQYDLIIVTSPPLFVGITAIVLSWWKQIPFLFEIRDLWPESAIEVGVLKNKLLIRFAYWFEQNVYRKAKLINVLTPAFREILIQEKNIPAEKIIYISNGADFPLADQIRADLDVSAFRKEYRLEGKFVIVYVGAHGIANHLIQIIEAATLLQNTNAHFLLIGDGKEKEELMTEVQKRKLLNIQFLNSVSKNDVFKYIMASDMGTSVLKKTEIFKTIYSNKTFDYFSCKKPVLMAIDGISRLLVEDADAGIFIEPENARDFADKVKYYIDRPHLLTSQGENGYHYAKVHFDRDDLAKKYLNYLTNYFGNHR
ncbi:glycosyltransferase family 4 protein [Dyadobacter sp. NIV53]|uniref:glycosyltransferase family 4 protein n=1 Tax=Dyadobacter sp. NIV53 TaxID=2861765 RepID=UPI001C84FB66|nr:glycosyltransferase family 4 protein [Dyadobacter sp. NIV53]